MLAARRDRAHVELLAAQRVHADAVAEQRATGATAGRVDRDDGNAPLGKVLCKPVQQLVGDARLAGAARTGDADDRYALGQRPLLAQLGQRIVGELALLDCRDHCRNLARFAGGRAGIGLRLAARVAGGLGALDQVVDHLVEAELHAVVRVIDARDAVVHQLADFLRRDRAAAAAEHLDMAGVVVA